MAKKTSGKRTYSFGTCAYARTSPTNISSSTKVLNIIVPFEEALKLNLAIDEGVRKLNQHKRSTTVGKRAALNLVVHLDQGAIAVAEEEV